MLIGYETGWFWIDFSATIQWSWFLSVAGFPTQSPMIRLLRLIKVLLLSHSIVAVLPPHSNNYGNPCGDTFLQTAADSCNRHHLAGNRVESADGAITPLSTDDGHACAGAPASAGEPTDPAADCKVDAPHRLHRRLQILHGEFCRSSDCYQWFSCASCVAAAATQQSE